MSSRLQSVLIAGVGVFLISCTGVRAAEHSSEASQAPAITGPISLADAVRLAIERHPSIEVTRASARAAGAQVRAVRSSQRLLVSAANYFTHASAPIAFTAPSPAPPAGINSATPFNYGYTMPEVPHYGQNIMAMLPVYTGGRGRSELRRAVAMQQAADHQSIGTEQQVALRTKEAYFGVLLAQAVASLYEDELRTAQRRLADAEERSRTDGVAQYEVLRQRAEVAHVRQQLTNARRDLGIAQLDLKMSLALPRNAEVTLSDPLGYRLVAGTLEEQIEIAERQSPEIAQAEAHCAAAEETLAAAKRSSKPNVYACVVQANAANIGARGLGGTVFALCTYFPLFDSGVRRAAREQSKAHVSEVKASCEQMKQEVHRDVAAAWLSLQAAAENVQTSEAAAAQAEESAQALQLRYEARRSTQTEVIDALAARTRARLDHLRALYDYNVARARLDRAVGRI
jgi:outer membrane protein